MTRPATSTPRPLAQEREHVKKRGTLGKLRSVPSRTANGDDRNSGLASAQTIQTMNVEPVTLPDQGNGLTPAKTIQEDDTPLARRTAIQTNEGESKTRLAMFARI